LVVGEIGDWSSLKSGIRPPLQWHIPVNCAKWAMRDVVAHLTYDDHLGIN
jgi:Mycothiol maleylpyruvate isomerase N-terminal domain.